MIDDGIRQLVEGRNFAVLSTVMPNGQVSGHVMWVDCDDEHVLFNTELHRQKMKTFEKDKRVGVTIIDQDNPYHYGEIRGTVVETVRGPEARAHIDKLCRKYQDKDYDRRIRSERVIVKVLPERQRVRGAPGVDR